MRAKGLDSRKVCGRVRAGSREFFRQEERGRPEEAFSTMELEGRMSDGGFMEVMRVGIPVNDTDERRNKNGGTGCG